MNDEFKLCGICNHEHCWGILRYSQDGVALYGARPCIKCRCDHFAEKLAGHDNLPALKDEMKELWAATSFLNSQVPAATRQAVRGIAELMKATDLQPLLANALSEFAGLMISQVTDIRGAMFRDESKFAHLVAHTDEIVEAMRGVVQLNERLSNIYGAISQIQQQQAKTEADIAGIAAVLKKLAPESVEIAPESCERCGHSRDNHTNRALWCRDPGALPACECPTYIATTDIDAKWVEKESALRMFREKIGPLTDEPIVIDPDDE